MVTREIDRAEWAEFFDELSDAENLKPVTVEAVGPDVGSQVVAREMPLVGITTTAASDEPGPIEIIVGDSPNTHVSHVVSTPSHVRLAETEEGDPQTLEIEADNEPTTLVRFHAGEYADVVDGTEQMEGS